MLQAGALVHALSIKSVAIEADEHNGRVLAKIADFSMAAMVTQRDRVDLEEVSVQMQIWVLVSFVLDQ
jgi:hypothetical protein